MGAALAVVAAGSFLKGAIGAASDLAENQSKVGVVFGKSAAQIMKASKTSATAMGLSKSAYLGATGSLGNLLVSLDIAPKKAAGMSQQMVKLAGDLASFNNVSPEEALQALQSGLTGETEPLKRFGVNMNDATLKAQALKMGLIKSTKDALTPQTKALAAQALIMDQTKTAQGDFARTSGGLANQQRILAARFEDTKATVGKFLLPLAIKATTALNNMGKVTGPVGKAFSTLFGGSPARDAAGGFAEILDNIFGNTGKLIGPLTKVGGVILGLKSGFSAFQSAFKSGNAGDGGLVGFFERVGVFARNAIPVVKAFIATLVTNLTPILQTMANTFTTKVLPAVTGFVSYVVANLIPIVKQIASIFVTNVLPVLSRVAQFIYGTLVPAVLRIVTSVAGSLKPVFDALFKQIQTTVLPIVTKLLAKFQEWWPTISKVIMIVVKVIGVVLRLAAAILGKVLPPLIRFAGFLIRNVFSAVATVIGIVVKIIGKIIEFGTAVVNAGKKVGEFAVAVKNKIGDAIGFVKDLPGKAKDALGNLKDLLLDKGKDIVQGLIDGIAKMGSKLKAFVVKFVKDHVPGPVAHVLGISSPSKVMAEQAKWIPLGMVKGMDSQSAALTGAAQRMAARVALHSSSRFDFAGSGPVGGRTGAAGGGAQITVYDRSGDPTRTAHETARLLAFAGGS